jgi:septum formation protein
MKIILGTASKWRRIFFKELGYDFEVMMADIDEKQIRSDDFRELPVLVAKAKAKALLQKIKEPVLLVTIDEIVVFKGKILEKLNDEHEARETLKSFANEFYETYTGVCVTNTENNKTAKGVDVAKVFFKEIPEDVIEELIGKGNIMNCAGSTEIEDPLLRKYVDRIEGYPDSVAGLPKKLVKE